MAAQGKDVATHYERRRRAVHDRIVAAALQRFEQAGIENTKVDEICARAKVAQKTFFNHFPTKQHLIREIAGYFLNQMVGVIEESRALLGTTEERLVHLFDRMADEAEATPPMRRMLVVEVIRLLHDDLSRREIAEGFRKSFEALLRQGVRAREVTKQHPISVLSQVMAGSLYVLILDWVSIDDFPMRVRGRALAKFLGDALAPRTIRGVARVSASRRRGGQSDVKQARVSSK